MMLRFWMVLCLSFLVTLTGIAGAAWLVTTVAPGPPLKRFINDIFEFDLAPGWSCDLDETEYVCNKGKRPYAATAIIAMKRRNADDNLDAYEAHLRQPPDYGNGQKPVLRSLTRRRLADHEWVEGVILSSEIANWITVYLATSTSNVAVLATFSFHKDREAEQRKDIDIMMSSLRIHQLPPQ